MSEEERPACDIFLMEMRSKHAKQLTQDTLTEQARLFVQAAP